MWLTVEQKLERLVRAFEDDKVSDAVTVLERWRDGIEAHAAQEEARIKGLADVYPVWYGIARLEDWNDVDAAGTFIKRRIARERLRVREKDIPAFCKERGIKQAELWPVLRGEKLEVGDYRAFDGQGSASRVFIDRSAIREQVEQDRAEDKKWAAYSEGRNGLLRQRGATPQEPIATDYMPGGDR